MSRRTRTQAVTPPPTRHPTNTRAAKPKSRSRGATGRESIGSGGAASCTSAGTLGMIGISSTSGEGSGAARTGTSSGKTLSRGGSASTHCWPSCKSQRPVRALSIQCRPSSSVTRNWATWATNSSDSMDPLRSWSSNSRYFCSASAKCIYYTSRACLGRALAHYSIDSMAVQTL
jgi:hypothetical protein